MTERDKLIDCESLIDACGSAVELAELYNEIKPTLEYHNIDKTILPIIRNKIKHIAGVPDEYDAVLEKAIGTF